MNKLFKLIFLVSVGDNASLSGPMSRAEVAEYLLSERESPLTH
jgi:hypothetical protein